MTAVEVAVFYSIAAAVLCWAAGEASRSRTLWTAGALLTLVHSSAAFVVFYGGSHDLARLETARQTAALTGLDFAGGIYVNYAFLLIWIGDAAWWWLDPRSYRARPRAVTLAVHGFIFFIILNGAVIFADGWARLVGAASTAIVLAAWVRRLVRPTPMATVAP